MAEQLVFDLPCRTARGRDDYFVSPANKTVLSAVDNWRNWTDGKLALGGPRGSGKSHLTCVWAEAAQAQMIDACDLGSDIVPALVATGAVAVEDVDRLASLSDPDKAAAEQALLHLHNFLTAEGGALLVTGVAPPSRWDIALPDLASRLRATQTAILQAPDDRLLSAVLVKLFDDRQLVPTPNAVKFLVDNMERSLAMAAEIVDRLDHAALQQKRAVTRTLASDILGSGKHSPLPLRSET